MPDRFRPGLPTAQQPSVEAGNRKIDSDRAKRRLSAIIAAPGKGTTATVPDLPANLPPEWFGRPEDASRGTLDRANQFSQSSGLDRAEADNAAMAAQTRAEAQDDPGAIMSAQTGRIATGIPKAVLGGLAGLLHPSDTASGLGQTIQGAGHYLTHPGELMEDISRVAHDPEASAEIASNLGAAPILAGIAENVPAGVEAVGGGLQKAGGMAEHAGNFLANKTVANMTLPGLGAADAIFRGDPKGVAVAAAPYALKYAGKGVAAVGRGIEGVPESIRGLGRLINPDEALRADSPFGPRNAPVSKEVPYRNTTPARDFMDDADYIRDVTTTPTGPSTGRPQYITQQAPSTFSTGAAMKATGLKPNSPAWVAMEHLLEPGDPMGPTNTPQEVAASARTSPSLASVQERARGTSIAPTENAWSSLAKLARGESEAPPWSPAAETLGEQDPQFTPVGGEEYFNTGRGASSPLSVSGGGLDLTTAPGGTTHSLGADELAGMSDEAFKRAVSKPAGAPDFSGLSDLDRAARLAALQRLMGS